MSVAIAVGVYLVVHLVGVYLLRASGTWRVLFAPGLDVAPDRSPDPLQVAPRGWIENHSFWDLDTDDDKTGDTDRPDEQVFWGTGQRGVG